MRRFRFKADLERAIALAMARASAAGHPKVTAYHLLDALLEDGDIQELVNASGGSIELLRSAVGPTSVTSHLHHSGRSSLRLYCGGTIYRSTPSSGGR
jgi:ATP-dependent Clp protease ATP-binding subunit ClpA